MQSYRVFIEKKEGFRNEAEELLSDIRETLGISTLKGLRLYRIYEADALNEAQFQRATASVFSEVNTDNVLTQLPALGDHYIAWEAVPGQFDQRADSAAQCIRLLFPDWKGRVTSGKLLVLEGSLSDKQEQQIASYIINPMENRAKDVKKEGIEMLSVEVVPLKSFEGFISWSSEQLESCRQEAGMAMTLADLEHVQKYFRDREKRDPSETELKVLDTYWSDHCRHTTFETELTEVQWPEGLYGDSFKAAWNEYIEARKDLKRQDKPRTLMDMATLAGREMRAKGQLDDMEVSEEINACSVKIDVTVNGKKEPWLLMFKNETHNHPTEIEPFGGASTCVGGAIRDPLSGRSYVYQAMRITGAGNPTVSMDKTLPGKLAQKVITRGAAHGYSSYGNQIGLATSLVKEIYHPGYQAKRLEVGAVVGAAPLDWVRRESPLAGDIIILLGGKTGRDGCGGATGSSKVHTEESLESCGAEVQKGNAPEERKIQRLFRNSELTKLIKKCNDFGAGGVSVAIGELADGLDIDMDKVPVKYLGLNGTELAISESQERMAVVVSPEDAAAFRALADKENLETTEVAVVTDTGRLRMTWKGETLVDLARDFLDTNGVRSSVKVNVQSPDLNFDPFARDIKGDSLKERILNNLKDLNVCSQKGMGEMFDGTVGAGTVFMPYGGKRQMSESEASVHTLPVEKGDSSTASLMAHGYNPIISSWSPFHGSQYAVVESLARIAAVGGDWKMTRLSFQEYFQRMTTAEIWGQPLAALTGALQIQRDWKIPAIGGKDSMSGTFGDLHVPPTLISFAVTTGEAPDLTSSEFKAGGSKLYFLKHTALEDLRPDSELLKGYFTLLDQLREQGVLLSASTVKEGGLSETLFKASVGNSIGFDIQASEEDLFNRSIGSILIETTEEIEGMENLLIGSTLHAPEMKINGENISLNEAEKAWKSVLQPVFHDLPDEEKPALEKGNYSSFSGLNWNRAEKIVKPKVLLPVFPGTNCEYDTARAFQDAGADTEIFVFRNRDSKDIRESLEEMSKALDNSQILMLSGGFSAGDEPDGSGKFIANVLHNEEIANAVHRLLDRDGLILGICNGFQALIKSGLLPFGRVGELTAEAPTLAHNNINRHISRMAETRVASRLSPWMQEMEEGDIHNIALSHGEGRFYADSNWVKQLKAKGQICFQYADESGNPTLSSPWNPNGSTEGIEGICSEDGRILGKMGHSERYRTNLFQNIPGEKDQPLFKGGVKYFI